MIDGEWTDEQLLSLQHNDHARAFRWYLEGRRHTIDKQEFLFTWIDPKETDVIVECGSSSGKTCIDLARRSGCRILGIDFDEEAVELARRFRDTYFPELSDRCRFRRDDLTEMTFERNTTKVIMPDFTEHIPDSVFEKTLRNIKRQLPHVLLYIYTPSRTHFLERMRHRNYPSGHINVKTEEQLRNHLEQKGWSIIHTQWRPSHLPVFIGVRMAKVTGRVLWAPEIRRFVGCRCFIGDSRNNRRIRRIESLLGRLPVLGLLFHRRAAVVATPKATENTLAGA